MANAYKVICHLISVCVVIQTAVIAWAGFEFGQYIESGNNLSPDKEFAGFVVHSIVGQFIIPFLAIALIVVALIAKAGLKWAAWLLLAVVVQVALGMISHGVPVLGILHGIVAFAVLGLAETGARFVGRLPPSLPRQVTPLSKQSGNA